MNCLSRLLKGLASVREESIGGAGAQPGGGEEV
jgi:hypothetical protein